METLKEDFPENEYIALLSCSPMAHPDHGPLSSIVNQILFEKSLNKRSEIEYRNAEI